MVCYNVIEHLPDVHAALIGFCQSLKRGGLILIGARESAELAVGGRHQIHAALVPRLVLIAFSMARLRSTRPARRGAVPDFFHPLVTPANLATFAGDHGLEVIYRKEYESPLFPEMRARIPRGRRSTWPLTS